MEKKDVFTNENLSKKFKNNFELVNYAIKLAENMIESGREPRVKSDVQNRAMLVLQEIREEKDEFVVITEQVKAEPRGHREEYKSDYSEERGERRKNRSALNRED